MACSGKALVKAQRYKAYHIAHGRQGSSTPRQLPRSLLIDAKKPLPEDSYLFRQATQSTQLLDETGLDVWDTGPPYPTGPPSGTPRELAHTKRLVEVMHGRRVRMQREREAKEAGMSQQSLKERGDTALEAWHAASAFMEYYDDGHRELTMARLWVQWLAREVSEYQRRCLN